MDFKIDFSDYVGVDCRIMLCLVCVLTDVWQSVIFSKRFHEEIPDLIKPLFWIVQIKDDEFGYRSRDTFVHETDVRALYLNHFEEDYPDLAECILNTETYKQLNSSYLVVKYKDGDENKEYKVFDVLTTIKNYYFLCMSIKKYNLFDIAIKQSDKVDDAEPLTYDMCDEATRFSITGAIEQFYYQYGIDLRLVPQTEDIKDPSNPNYPKTYDDFDHIFRRVNLLDSGMLFGVEVDINDRGVPYYKSDFHIYTKDPNKLFVSSIISDFGNHTGEPDDIEQKDQRREQFHAYHERILEEIEDAKEKYDLIIVPYEVVTTDSLLSEDKYSNTHANYLVYSKYDNCVMRYDPNGSAGSDIVTQELLEKAFPGVDIYTNFTYGFQRYDYTGYCATYAYIFMTLFLLAYQLCPGVNISKLFYCIEIIIHRIVAGNNKNNDDISYIFNYIAVKASLILSSDKLSEYLFYQPCNAHYAHTIDSLYLYIAGNLYVQSTDPTYQIEAEIKEPFTSLFPPDIIVKDVLLPASTGDTKIDDNLTLFMTIYLLQESDFKEADMYLDIYKRDDDENEDIIENIVTVLCSRCLTELAGISNRDIFFAYKLLFWTEVIRYLMIAPNIPKEKLIGMPRQMSKLVQFRFKEYIKYMMERLTVS